MKKAFVFFIFFFSVFSIMGSPSRTSPAPIHNVYGGIIFFKNTSSYSQYWEIDLVDDPEGGFYFEQICLEIDDVIKHTHLFYVLFADDAKFDRKDADPNNYFKAIRIYDMDTGTFLKEFNAGEKIFVLTGGNIESGAIWEIDIADSFFEGVY
ncbi:MAG: hypothetical protein LBI06_02125 [Treponema sp.]|jgi:hypothetical protein|nr:hypothetical protein [Treponema sp.]